MTNILKLKFKNKKALVGIIGLGYVGLPLALTFAESNVQVIGFDIDIKKITYLKNSKSYIKSISNQRIKDALKKKLKVTNNFKKVSLLDAIIICLPTPLNKHNEPDLSYITSTVDRIVPFLKKNQLISLESTTYPGTTDEEIAGRLKSNNFKIGKNFFLVYSPEREDPGNKYFNTKNIPKIIGGYSKKCLSIGTALYESALDSIYPVSSTKTAEMTKLLENIHRAVNIGLVNEMKIVSDKMNIDIHEVIRAAATKPFGFTPFYPGPGLGGHCIPIDPFYLTWKAKEYGINTKFIELAGEINSKMPNWVVSKINETFNLKNKSINKSKILILGIAYKKDVNDTRESPSLEIINILKNLGALVDYSDPYVPIFPKLRNYKFKIKNINLNPKKISSYDAIVICTNHSTFDYKILAKNAKLIIDTRGVFSETLKNIVKA
jgi:UDP-N-acetyl-D-glucosamine dehydrogenase